MKFQVLYFPLKIKKKKKKKYEKNFFPLLDVKVVLKQRLKENLVAGGGLTKPFFNLLL